MVSGLPAVGPSEAVFRVARGFDVFAPPEWSYAEEDGTFGNRFDDPCAYHGVPEEGHFRVIYCATRRAAAFGETIARFRPSMDLLARLKEIEDDEPTEPELEGGVVPEEWRLSRRIGSTRLEPSLLFVDLPASETLRVLRRELAPVARQLGLADLDLGAIAGPQRRLTQEAARYIYNLPGDRSGDTGFAGIRYLSRLNPEWELWAIFHDRMRHTPGAASETIRADDPDLLEAASLFELSVE